MRLCLIEWPNTMPELVAIVAEFKSRGHEIVYWSGFNQRAIDKTNYPDTIFHDQADAIAGRGADGKAVASYAPPSEELLRELASVESAALTMMNKKHERLTVSERKHLYYDLVRYWNGVLTEINPELIIFWNVPHTVYDFIIYALARRRRISTLLGEYTLIGDRVVLSGAFETGNAWLAQAVASNKRNFTVADLAPDIREYYFKQVDPNLDTTPHYVQDYINLYRGWRAVKFKIKLLFASCKDLSIFSKALGYIAKQAQRTKAQAEYEALQSPPVLNEKFVYAPLHFQPESTTTPLGGVFVDQALLVETIAASVPPGWLIYVKEHPTQWAPWGGNYSSYRYPGYYQHLAQLPNVRLVPISTHSLTLIRHCQAVATVTGTAGWEAVVRAKPALTFGYPWYRQAPGVWRVNSVESCRSVFKRLAEGYAIDQQAVINYLYFLGLATFHGYYDSGVQKISRLTPEENKQNFFNALRAEIERPFNAVAPAAV